MTPAVLVLLGVALIAFAQRPRPARRTAGPVRRPCLPVCRRRPPALAVLRLIFDLAVLPFQAVVIVFARKNLRHRQPAARKNR